MVSEGKALDGEATAVDRAFTKVTQVCFCRFLCRFLAVHLSVSGCFCQLLVVDTVAQGPRLQDPRLPELSSPCAYGVPATAARTYRPQRVPLTCGTACTGTCTACTAALQEVRQIEEEMLVALSDQTTAEKSGSKTGSDIRELRKKIRQEELGVVEAQNELAKLQVCEFFVFAVFLSMLFWSFGVVSGIVEAQKEPATLLAGAGFWFVLLGPAARNLPYYGSC